MNIETNEKPKDCPFVARLSRCSHLNSLITTEEDNENRKSFVSSHHDSLVSTKQYLDKYIYLFNNSKQKS